MIRSRNHVCTVCLDLFLYLNSIFSIIDLCNDRVPNLGQGTLPVYISSQGPEQGHWLIPSTLPNNMVSLPTLITDPIWLLIKQLQFIPWLLITKMQLKYTSNQFRIHYQDIYIYTYIYILVVVRIHGTITATFRHTVVRYIWMSGCPWSADPVFTSLVIIVPTNIQVPDGHQQTQRWLQSYGSLLWPVRHQVFTYCELGPQELTSMNL